MDSGKDKKRKNVEGDRLSNLPDDLIHKILSYVSIKQAIETSGLSSRWRYIWTSMPVLNLSTMDFSRLPRFSKFVNRLLSNRNNESDVFSVNLTFRGKVWQKFVESILNYAVSHNIQQLNITCLPGFVYPLAEFSPSLFSSQTLKHLTLNGRIGKRLVMTMPAWAMPSLTTLNLHGVSFYDENCADLFSNCPNLKNLTFEGCIMLNSFIIRHHGLSSLTLEYGREVVNVFTPQLKNLTVKNWRGIHLVSAPNLSSLCYTDDYYSYKDSDASPLRLSTDLLHLEKVDIRIHNGEVNKSYAHKIVCLLQQLPSVKFLTLNLELVKLFSSVEVISHQPSPFVNLKSLKVYPVHVPQKAQPKVTMSDEVKRFLLDGSPNATFTMVSHEEIQAVMDVTSAQELMRDLEDKLKEYYKTNMSNKKAPMECHMAKLLEQAKSQDRASRMLEKINELLKTMPTSQRDRLQARFSGLCAKLLTIVRDWRNQPDKILSNPAASSKPSS